MPPRIEGNVLQGGTIFSSGMLDTIRNHDWVTHKDRSACQEVSYYVKFCRASLMESVKVHAYLYAVITKFKVLEQAHHMFMAVVCLEQSINGHKPSWSVTVREPALIHWSQDLFHFTIMLFVLILMWGQWCRFTFTIPMHCRTFFDVNVWLCYLHQSKDHAVEWVKQAFRVNFIVKKYTWLSTGARSSWSIQIAIILLPPSGETQSTSIPLSPSWFFQRDGDGVEQFDSQKDR